MMNESKDTRDKSTVENQATNDRRFLLIGFSVILVVFLGFGSWAAIAPLTSAAHAQGKVRVESNRKTVQHLEGGIVKSLSVRDGNTVEGGQVLMTLENTQPRAQMEVVEGKYILALARKARLIAQRDQLSGVPYQQFLHDLSGTDSRVSGAMAIQDQIFEVRQAAYENELALYDQQVEQLESQLTGLAAQKASSQKLVASYSSEMKDMAGLKKKGYVENRQVLDLERQLVENQGMLGELVARIASTRSKIVEAKLSTLQLQKEMQRETAAELNEVQEGLFQLTEQRQALIDTLERTVIRAPQEGRVLGLSIHTVGAVIGAGQKLMDIVPEQEKLIVEAKVSPLDIDRISVGQPADIRFSAFKMRDTARITGRLVTVSADSISEPEQLPYYLVVVEITDEGQKLLAESDLTLVAGMPAEVFINTGERTLFQYIVDPITHTLARSLIED